MSCRSDQSENQRKKWGSVTELVTVKLQNLLSDIFNELRNFYEDNTQAFYLMLVIYLPKSGHFLY